jgi:hypothetical protein
MQTGESFFLKTDKITIFFQKCPAKLRNSMEEPQKPAYHIRTRKKYADFQKVWEDLPN